MEGIGEEGRVENGAVQTALRSRSTGVSILARGGERQEHRGDREADRTTSGGTEGESGGARTTGGRGATTANERAIDPGEFSRLDRGYLERVV